MLTYLALCIALGAIASRVDRVPLAPLPARPLCAQCRMREADD